jgi:head-tail adaptor
MRSGGSYHRVKFFAKQITRDPSGASIDTWDFTTATITTRGEVRYTGGNFNIKSEEKFYSKNVELTVRYRSAITETMKVQIDGTNDIWLITFIEILGMKEGLRLTVEKDIEQLPAVAVEVPVLLSVADIGGNDALLTWTNNAANDGICIERSLNGSIYVEIIRIAKAVIPVTTYTDHGLTAMNQFWRIRAFHYYDYSAYSNVIAITTGDMKYTQLVNLTAGDNDFTTTLTVQPYNLEIIDSTGKIINNDLGDPVWTLTGGVYHLHIYSTDPITNVNLKILY